jgi:uncharacterized protein with ATP-grasp and redox domains
MKTYLECFPCFLRQTVIALNQYAAPDAVKEAIIRDVIALSGDADTSRPPAYTTTFIHRLIRERLGGDPFAQVKERYNDIALRLYPKLREEVQTSGDPLKTAARLAIAGNIIDFGIFTSIDIEDSVRRSLQTSIAVDDYDWFAEAARAAEDILYLLDNAGEVVFDRLLIEELVGKGKRVTAVVKGSPVLNDVTMRDAVQSGLTDVCDVLDNGSDAIGTIMEWTSDKFQEEFRRTDLVISKGQGNFETLTPNGKKTYFLFQAKCDVVSQELGLATGSMLLKGS